jgi:hypothetical protein
MPEWGDFFEDTPFSNNLNTHSNNTENNRRLKLMIGCEMIERKGMREVSEKFFT